MDNYYYLVSQLPSLVFDSPSSYTERDFLEESEKWLGPGEMRTLSGIRLDGESFPRRCPGLAKSYRVFEQTFRGELASYRQTVRTGGDFTPSAFPPSLLSGTPLEVEKNLLRFRWEWIESIEREHHFDLDFLILYYLKLQIQSRLALYRREEGMSAFQKWVEPSPPHAGAGGAGTRDTA